MRIGRPVAEFSNSKDRCWEEKSESEMEKGREDSKKHHRLQLWDGEELEWKVSKPKLHRERDLKEKEVIGYEMKTRPGTKSSDYRRVGLPLQVQ